MFLNFDAEIINAEQNQQWHKAIQIAYMNWKANPLDSNALLCAISEIWYVLTFYIDRLVPLESVSRDDLQEKLDETSKFAIEYFSENAEVNVMLGYYIKVMPYMFLETVNPDYDKSLSQGKKMVLRAHELAPNDLMIAAIYCDVFELPQFEESYNALWKKESVTEWSKSAVKSYFCRILHGDVENNIQ